MNDFVVKKDVWHYKLIDAFFSLNEKPSRKPKDFCTYWRKFFYSVCLSIIILAVLGGIVGMLIHQIVINPMGFAAGVGFIIALVGAVVGFVFVVFLIDEGRKKITEKVSETEPGIIRTKYRSFKEKYCPMVRYD